MGQVRAVMAEGSTDKGRQDALHFMARVLEDLDWLRWDQVRDGSGCADADIHELLNRGLVAFDDCDCQFLRLTSLGHISATLSLDMAASGR